jgi:ATP-dependent Lon protease
LPGYTEEEKLQIAFKYLIPRQIEENGLEKDRIKFSKHAVSYIISGYTRESGLRNLERLIGTVCRKTARKVAEGIDKKFVITEKSINKLLGPKKYDFKDELIKNELGVVTGLAWTQFGGEILFVECTRYKGKGNMVLTGQLGNVMKESARAALTHVRSIADKYDIDDEDFNKYDVHIHVPAGATPKDGPSAGITIATAILSVFTGALVKKEVAMTGEITITGNVLPIGGLKEKLFAAKRIGVKKVLVPKKNEKDLIKLPKSIKDSLEIIFVEKFNEVADIALDFSDKNNVK